MSSTKPPDNPREQGDDGQATPGETPVKKAFFAMTLEDHRRIGSSPPGVSHEKPDGIFQGTPTGTRYVDLIDSVQIHAMLLDNLREFPVLKAMGNRRLFSAIVQGHNRNIRFLREIGKLPPGFDEIPEE